MDHPPRHGSRGFLAAILLRTQPDAELVTLSRGGGEAAFEEIARRHGPALTGFAASVAPASQADDVVQEALLKAYTALRDGAEPEVLTAWLFRIVRNTAIDAQRGTRHHEQLDESHDGVEQPPQALERKTQLAALAAAINELPRAEREAIVQRELEGRGHEEIARSLGQSTGAVRQLIYRARNSLRESVGGLIPPALVRLAAMPGANEAAGGVGLAAVVKVGLAAIVATGTIVAGATIHKGGSPSSAQAHQLALPGEGADRAGELGGSRSAGAGDKPDRSIGRDGGPPSPSSSGEGTAVTDTPDGDSGQSGDSGSGSGSGSDLGSGDHEPGPGSEPGSDSSPGSEPGSGDSTEPSEPGGGDEPTTPGGDGPPPPPPSEPPGDGGDGTRI